MRADQVTVQLGDGQQRTRTLYSTHHGPVFTSILGLPLFPWTPSQAHAMGDANAANFRYLNHFFETNHAQTVRELDEVLRRNQGIPWVNTIAADSKGEAYYADLSVVPHVTDQKAQECNTALGAAAFAALRLPVLDGSRSACEWGRDDDAIQPGTFGPRNLPHLFRNDYVTNGNDSYWLSNPKQPLTGFARIIGDEETARSLRTRLGLIMVEQRMAGSDGRPGKGFTLAQLQETVFNNRQYAAELWRDELVQMCNANPTIESSGGPVDVSAACPILAAWDMRDDLDSRGAVLFRRFASRALGTGGQPYSQGFSSSDPVNTPRGLNTSNPQVRQAFGDAVRDLRDSGIPLDARLRDYQFVMRGQEKIPIHGGPGTVGVFNAINVSWVPGQGYPNVPHGSSFVMTTHLNGSCPDARSILTYSQSTNPESPYFGDQTRMFSRKEWVDLPFCEREIQRDPALTACTASAGSDAVVVRRRGRGLSVRGAKGTARPTVVELYQVAIRNRVTRYRLVARFKRRGASFTWSGRPPVADGHYVLRVKRGSGRAATTRRLALRRSAGRYRVGPNFERRETCRLLTSFRLSRPAFGGRTRNSLGISYRVAFPADVRIEVLRGRRVIRTFRRSGRRAGRTHREKLRSRGLRAGRYRVRITARWRRATETATLTAARL
jgi:acyl-homoserine-lactone acylase